jgi:hypothetical protein
VCRIHALVAAEMCVGTSGNVASVNVCVCQNKVEITRFGRVVTDQEKKLNN